MWCGTMDGIVFGAIIGLLIFIYIGILHSSYKMTKKKKKKRTTAQKLYRYC